MRVAAGYVRRVAHRSVRSRSTSPAVGPARVGVSPQVDHVVTNLGPTIDAAVTAASRRMRVGADADYDLVQENFDVLHYLLQSPRLVERPRVDLVEHFLSPGATQRRSPDPNFSMGNYLARHPERANGSERSPYLAWLKFGRSNGEIADPAPRIDEMAQVLGLETAEVVQLLVERRRSLQRRFRHGRLGEVFAKAAEIEPLIGATWVEVADPKMLPFSTPAVTGQISAIHRAQEAADFATARLILVINRPRWGSGRRIEGHIAHALTSQVASEEIVVVYTDDTGETPRERFPAGVREIHFAEIVRSLDPEDAQRALVALLRSLNADAVININSRLLYRAMQTYGKALAASERIFPCFFCNEQSPLGHWQGWSLRYFYRTFDEVAGVITDSQFLADELLRKYRVPPNNATKVHVFRAPVDDRIEPAPRPTTEPGRRPQVFWAGRWDRQKRIGLFFDLARRMPDIDFRMWGETVMAGQQQKVPPNVTSEGRYAHFSELPLGEADAWLYTSGWDGVPSQLLEVALTGVPIVGTEVGGTGEVLGKADAWPVPEQAGAPAYELALREVLADPAEARRRAASLRERMLKERTRERFASHASDVLLISGEETADGGAP